MPEENASLSGQPENASGATASNDVTESALKAAQKMQDVLSFTPAPIPKDVLLMATLKKIPLLTGLLGDADATTSAIGELVQATGKAASGLEKAVKGLHFAGLALDIVNFVRIPCIYLAAYILGIKPPITLTNNAKWLYSAVLLAAAIVSLAFPAAAPFIAIGTAVIALGVAAFTLGKLLYQRHQHKKEIKDLTAEIAAEEQNFLDIQARAQALESNLKKAVAEHDDKLASQLTSDIALLANKFEEQKQTLQALYDKRFVHQESLKKKDIGAIADKAMAVILAAVAVIGLVVSLFFPPIGLGLLAGAGAAGLVYMVGRLMTPLFVKLGNWIYGKVSNMIASSGDSKDKDTPDLGNKLTLDKASEPVLENSPDPITPVNSVEPGDAVDVAISSTAVATLMLAGNGAHIAQLHASEALNDELHDKKPVSKPVLAKSHSRDSLSLVAEEHEEEGEGETEREGGKHKIR